MFTVTSAVAASSRPGHTASLAALVNSPAVTLPLLLLDRQQAVLFTALMLSFFLR